MRRAPTVLMYHRVLPADDCVDYPFPSLVMPAQMFRAQVAWLAEHTELVTLERAVQAASEPRPRRPLVAITFDDGYWDNIEVAAPILREFGAPATFFVTTEFVSGASLMWYDRAAIALPQVADEVLLAAAADLGVTPPPAADVAADRTGAWVEAMKASTPQARAALLDAIESGGMDTERRRFYRAMEPAAVRELAAAGHEIGSHSVSHEILPLLDDDALRTELEQSRDIVAGWSERPVDAFCYPNGSVDDRVVAATRAAGYVRACTTAEPSRSEPVEPLSIPRVDVTPSRVTGSDGSFDLVAFRAEISQFHSLLR